MKTARIFATLLVLIAPSFALAFTAQSGESLNITTPVSDDLYVAWARVSVQSPITGDLIMAGSDLSSEGSISESLMIAGANIDISSAIGDDLRAAGANIRVRSIIAGDAVIAGGNIDIKKETTIGKDLIIGAWNIYLDGTVKGKADITAGKVYLNGIIEKDTHIRAQEIMVGSGAQILGNLQYESAKVNPALEGIVSWTKQFSEQKSWDKKKGEKEIRNGLLSFIFSYILLKILFLTVFGFLLYSFMRKYIHEVSDILTKSPWISLFVGISFFILVPIIALLLVFTLIGIPVAALMMTVLVFIFIFYELIGTVIFSSWVINRYMKKWWKDSWWYRLLVIFGFAFIFGIISGIDIIFAWMAIGALLTRHWKLIESIRK